mgnify:CR=1 FL=1
MNTKSIYTVFLSVIISAGVSAQKVEWKYSTQLLEKRKRDKVV